MHPSMQLTVALVFVWI